MFVESGFVYVQLNDTMINGRVSEDEPIFSEFNLYLRSLGLDVLVSTYQVRAQFIAGRPSCMSIYLRTSDNMVQNGIDQRLHNWGGTHKHTNGIVEYWKALLRKHGFPESHVVDKMHVDFYSFEEIYLVFLPRKCKVKVVEAINNLLMDRGPKHVFCSSEPAYNVVFASEKVFAENVRLGYLDKVVAACDQVLTRHDSFGYYRQGVVKVHFYHCDDKDLNLYGLSRED